MSAIFNALYDLHPTAPIVFLALMANGLYAPVLYAWRKRVPFDIKLIRAKSKAGDSWARYVYLSWLAFAVSAAMLAAALVIALLRK